MDAYIHTYHKYIYTHSLSPRLSPSLPLSHARIHMIAYMPGRQHTQYMPGRQHTQYMPGSPSSISSKQFIFAMRCIYLTQVAMFSCNQTLLSSHDTRVQIKVIPKLASTAGQGNTKHTATVFHSSVTWRLTSSSSSTLANVCPVA